MKLFSLIAIAVLVLFAAGNVNAQTAPGATSIFAPYVDAGISASSTTTGAGSTTARNPDYRVGLGVESNTKHLLLIADGQFDSANYRTFGFANGSSYKGTITGSGYAKLGFLLVGGGVRWSDQVTNGNLSVLKPNVNELVGFVGGGAQFKRDRFTIVYVLPGRNTTTNQREFDFHNELYLTKGGHFRLTQDVVGTTGDTGLQIAGQNFGTRFSGGSAGAGLKIVF